MPQKVKYGQRTYTFPDDATDAEIASAIGKDDAPPPPLKLAVPPLLARNGPPESLFTPPESLRRLPDEAPQTSTVGTIARAFGRRVLPSAAATAAFGTGFATAGALTAPAEAVPGPGTLLNLSAALLGGLGSAYVADTAVSKLQDVVLDAAPRVKKALGQDEAQLAADRAEHPYVQFGAELAPSLLFMRPGFSAHAVPDGASLLTRTLARPVAGSAIGAGITATGEGVNQYRTGKFDAGRLGLAAAFGAAGNRPTRLGGSLFQAGGNAGSIALSRTARAAGQATGAVGDITAEAFRSARNANDVRTGRVIVNPPQPIAPTGPIPTARAVVPVARPRPIDPVAPAAVPPEPAISPVAPVTLPAPSMVSLGAAAITPPPEPVMPAPTGVDLRPDPGPLGDGEHYITTPAGNRIRSKYEVVDARTLQPATGELQNRDRSRGTTDLQVQDIIAGFDPTRLGPSAETDRGAPIVGPDSIVESGNGRMLALNRIYSDPSLADKAQAYRGFIEQQGLSTEGVEQPILIRRRANDLTPEQRRQFVVDSNKDAKLAMTSVERAKSDADSFDTDTLAKFRGGDIGAAGNTEFVRSFIGKLPSGEAASLIDENQQVSQEGVRRIEHALMARAYEDPAVLSKLIEARDNNIRSIGSGLLDNAAGYATLRSAIKEGSVKPEYDVTPQLVEAAKRVSDLRSSGGKVGDLLTQQDAFNQLDPVTESFIRAFYNPDLSRAASRESITSTIGAYVRRASEQTAAPKLFGDDGETTPAEILSTILAERVEGGTPALFDAPADREQGDLPQLGDDIEANLARRKAERIARQSNTQENANDPQGTPQRNEGGNGRRDEQGQEEAQGRRGERAQDVAEGGSEGGGRRSAESSGAGGREGSGVREGSLNETPDYTAGRQLDDGAYTKSFEDASKTMRASIYSSAAEAVGVDPDKFTLMPAPRQVALLQQALKNKFGLSFDVSHGLQERFAIDQMLDAYQNVQGMAHVLDLPNMAMSLGGNLKIALQAKGRYLGVFYPGKNIIGLPRRTNSFAHEWGHALDFHLLEAMADTGGRGLTGLIRKEGNGEVGAPLTVRDAFTDLLNAMFFDKVGVASEIMALEAKIQQTESVKVKATAQAQIDRLKDGSSQKRDIRSDFYKGAKSFDGPGGDYWTSPTEMFARAFEAYVSYKTEAAGLTTEFIGKGDAAYLSNAEERFAKTFPKGEERGLIFAAFEQLFGNIAHEQMIATGVGAEKPEPGTVNRITDLDKTPKVARERNIIKRQMAEIRREANNAKKAAAGRPDDPKGLLEKIADVNGVAFMSMAANLRMIEGRYNSPSLRQLVDKLTKQDGKGDRTVPRTFSEDVHLTGYAALNRLSNIVKAHGLEDMTAEDDMALRDLLTGSRTDAPAARPGLVKAAAAIRRLLDNEFYVNQRAGIDLGYTRNGYLARVLDLPKVMDKPERFVTQATKVYRIVFDREFTDPESVLALDPAEFKSFMRMAGRLAKSHDIPSLPAFIKLLKQSNALAKAFVNSDDPDAIQAKIDELMPKLSEAMAELYPEVQDAYALDRAEAWHGKVLLSSDNDNNAGSPDNAYTKKRDLPAEADKLMEYFYLSNPIESVTNYLQASARRTSYAKRFGVKNEVRDKLFEGMAKEGVSAEDRRTVARILNIVTGRQRSEIAPILQRAEAAISAYTQMSLLPRATISSLAEPFTAGLVTGNASDGFKMLGSMISSVLGSPNGRVRYELSRAMGIVADIGGENILMERYGNSFATGSKAGKAVSRMYQRTGLVALTKAQKDAGVGVAHAFLDNLALNATQGNATSKAGAVALMREFGIREPEAFAKEMLSRGRIPTVEELDSDFGHDYATAQLRLSNMMVQEPGKLDRPEFATYPVLRMFYGIMGFSYSYWRNIVKRNGLLIGEIGKSKERGGPGKAALYGSRLFAAAAAAYVVGTVVSTIRERLLNPKRWHDLELKGELYSTMLQLGFTRTFSFGLIDTAINVATGLKYRRSLSQAVVGAGPGNILQNIGKVAEPVANNSRKTNTAEYNATTGAYQLASPFLNFGLSRLPGGPVLAPATGAAMAFVTSPAAGDGVATLVNGPKNNSLVNGKKVKSGPTGYDKMLDRAFGPPKKKSAGN